MLISSIKKLKNRIKFSYATKNKKVITSDGMPRSGSTALFNIIRLVIKEHDPGNLYSCWIDDLKPQSKKIVLIKIHSANSYMLSKSKNMFYTYRDIRHALESSVRMFGSEPTLEHADNLVQQYNQAKNRGYTLFSFEEITENPEVVISSVAANLNVTVDVNQILRLFNQIRPPSDGSFSKDTLLHYGHITKKTGNTEGVLSPSFRREVERRHSSWFLETGYDVI